MCLHTYVCKHKMCPAQLPVKKCHVKHKLSTCACAAVTRLSLSLPLSLSLSLSLSLLHVCVQVEAVNKLYFRHLRNATSWGCTRDRDESAAQIDIKGPYPLCKNTQSLVCPCICVSAGIFPAVCLSICFLSPCLVALSGHHPRFLKRANIHTVMHNNNARGFAAACLP